MKFARRNQTKASPAFNRVTVQHGSRPGNEFRLQDLEQLPEEMMETNLKR